MARLWTVGHSNRTLPELLALLEEAAIRRLVDVRRYPASRRHPQFGAGPLAAALAERGLRYAHLPDLGGHRRVGAGSVHAALAEPALQGYAEHMASLAFQAAFGRLDDWLREQACAVLCAERLPQHCHRRLLSDAALARGIEVVHLLAPGEARIHVLSPEARIVGTALRFDRGAQGGLFEG